MKPRSIFENQVVASNERLTTLNPKSLDWALNNLIEYWGFSTVDKTVTCSVCGHKFKHEGKKGVCQCPHCRTSLVIHLTRIRTRSITVFYSVLDTIDGLQVQRVVAVDVKFRKGLPMEVSQEEVMRMWLNAKGKMAVTARKRPLMGYYVDRFILDSDIELRTLNEIYLKLADTEVYPIYKAIPELRRNAMRGKLPPYVNPYLFMRELLKDSRIETLMKAGQSEAIYHFISNRSDLDVCWNSLKVALRHGYKITNFSMWCDLVKLLDKAGRDIRSVHYICPDNLPAEHDRWLTKERMRKDKEDAKKRYEQALQKEAEFIKAKSCFFGLSITDDDIEISVLDSIAAYRAEGMAMHHCVFECSYYSKEDTIILSAHNKQGERIETVEFSLKELKVIQSRGVNNTNTKYHERIINLVNVNAHKFIEARESA